MNSNLKTYQDWCIDTLLFIYQNRDKYDFTEKDKGYRYAINALLTNHASMYYHPSNKAQKTYINLWWDHLNQSTISFFFQPLLMSFAAAKYLGIDQKYIDGLEHVGYGMVSLPEGKMSTRKGNFLKVEDILNDSISKTAEILNDRDIEDKEAAAKMIGIGAIVFANQKENRIKDQVFDINEALNFNGETGPYVQYAAVRCKSILEKANFAFDANEEIDYSVLTNDSTIEVVKLVSNFSDIIVQAKDKSEPSIITRYLIKVAQEYSSFYNKNKVICEEANVQTARLYLTYMVEQVLTAGLNLLGIKVPDHM